MAQELTVGNRLRKLLLVFFVFSFALLGCAPSIPLLVSETENTKITVPQEWESHGAYYLIDEAKILASFERNAFYSGPTTKWLLHKVIQITSKEGVKQASMPVPFFGILSKFVLIMNDSTGKPMPLDTLALRRHYLAKGRIDFPNAHPGCKVGVMVTLTSAEPVSWMDHWFSSALPVLRGLLSFSYSSRHFTYEFKEYGGLAKGKEVATAKNGVVTMNWEVVRQIPRSKISYQEGVDVSEPRLALALREALRSQVFDDWRKLTKQYERVLMDKSTFASERALRRVTDSLTRDKNKAADKAAAILAYCQDNLTLVDGSIHAIRPDAVLKAQKGTLWDISVVAKTMLENAGLETRFWLTRPRHRGGIDADFITPGALLQPILGVKIDTSWRMFYPFRRGYALGEYDRTEFNPKAVTIDGGELELLPKPVLKNTDFRQEYTLDLGQADSAIQNETIISGHGAMFLRNTLYDLSDKDRKEYFQSALRRQNRQNALISADVTDLKKRGEPLKIHLVFASPNQVVERKGKAQIRVGPLFDMEFDGLDSARTSAYFREIPVHSVETIHLLKPSGRKSRLELQCDDQKNSLFEVHCERKEDSKQITVIRTLEMPAARVGALALREFLPAIADLNRIREATVFIE